ncbi:hypothetical protein PYCCODRAFT_1461052 [Trametes coccinea BRFM310]|uniref:Uncharacterized protein n=1 Tax=Trametes coccinea (strain BRFM310) TaxID=1353009 RepID=A0A1Y2ID45_TRAC3|nr:hypothetical protein PYCCODRAFT_1461052 [Trametes coccinea BRFM310]
MVEDEQDGPDLETLQAQIDMSMAFTNNIVSSWMKSSKAKLPSSSSRNDDIVLEEYMRKPARLGVGAAAPEQTGVLGRETAKLRSKLTGQGKKKREREDDDNEAESRARGSGSKSGGAAATAGSDDDEEDSRARVITKKARMDPFAVKGGEGKKKKKKADPLAVPAAKPKAIPPGAPPTAGEKGGEAQSSRETAGGGKALEVDAAPPPAPSGKKKKKKHKFAADQAGSHPDGAQPADPAVGDNGVASPHEKKVASDVPPTGPSKSPDAPTGSRLPGGERNTVAASAPPSAIALPTPAIQPTTSPSKAPSSIPKDPLGLPLLNLAGPPPGTGEDQSDSPKKRRKRKKKKKKAIAQPTADGGDENMSDDG